MLYQKAMEKIRKRFGDVMGDAFDALGKLCLESNGNEGTFTIGYIKDQEEEDSIPDGTLVPEIIIKVRKPRTVNHD
jgi:hypothetical protein